MIQLNLVVKALRRLSNEHQHIVWLQQRHTHTHIIMKIGIHLVRIAEILRLLEWEEMVQENAKTKFPRSGKLRHTTTGVHWTVLRLLMDAIEVPAAPAEDSPRADLPAADSPEGSNESQIESQSVCPSPSLDAKLQNLDVGKPKSKYRYMCKSGECLQAQPQLLTSIL